MNPQQLLDNHYRNNFQKLVKKYSRKYSDISDAEDMVQEAYIKAFNYLHKFRPSGNFKAWFSTILRNSHHSHIRGLIQRNSLEPFEEENFPMDLDLSKEISIKEVMKYMESKPDKQKDILHLYFIRGFSPAQISTVVTDISTKRVKNYIQEFKQEMREKFNGG